jgi:hypothetical protein
MSLNFSLDVSGLFNTMLPKVGLKTVSSHTPSPDPDHPLQPTKKSD